jgi:hypothetical protein
LCGKEESGDSTFQGESVAFQARTNDALGTMYVRILFTLPWKCVVHATDNDNFTAAVRRTIRQIYRAETDDDRSNSPR